jgi:hypothetical protein
MTTRFKYEFLSITYIIYILSRMGLPEYFFNIIIIYYIFYTQSVTENADKFWAQVPHTQARKNVHNNMCPEKFHLRVIAARITLLHIQLL